MPIKKINRGGPGDSIDKRTENANKSLHRIMQFVGESGLKQSRENGSFQDRTGNLRSSESYSIVEDGNIINESSSERFLDGAEGVSAGKSFRSELAVQHGKGITLIMVAGMDYAGEVESRGYDVLTSSELMAKKMIPRLLRKSGFSIS